MRLEAAIQAKVKGSFYKLPQIKLSFLQVTDAAETPLGNVITDRAGKAVFTVKPELLAGNAAGELHFKVSYAGNKQMEAGEEAVSYTHLDVYKRQGVSRTYYQKWKILPTTPKQECLQKWVR